MAPTTVCATCGCKIAVTRDRCPKCRAFVVQANPAAEAARSRSLARAAGIAGALFVASVTGLWLTRDPAPEAAPPKAAVADPLAVRRQSVPAPEAVEAPSSAEAQRAFLDPAGAATLSYAAGDHASALTQFEAAVERNPQDAESLSNLGQVLVKLGRVAEAIPHFERACTLNPDRWAYRFNLARALGLLQRWDESIAAYRQAQTLFPDDYVTTFNLALVLHKKGDEAAAVEEYKKAVALNPEEASFRMALAISYEQLQKKPEAAAEYAEYLRLSPDVADAEKVRARIALLTGEKAAAASN